MSPLASRLRRSRSKPPKAVLEHREQEDLAAWLSAALPFGTWTTTANGFLRTTAQRAAAAKQGVLFGLPDVLIFLQPPCWIELKRVENGTVKPHQALVHKALVGTCGMDGIVAYGADEAIAYVRQRYALAPVPPGAGACSRADDVPLPARLRRG